MLNFFFRNHYYKKNSGLNDQNKNLKRKRYCTKLQKKKNPENENKRIGGG